MKDFFKGVIFISLLIPLIEGIISLYQQTMEFLCAKIAIKTYEIQKTITNEKEEEIETNAIGFTIQSYDDEGE